MGQPTVDWSTIFATMPSIKTTFSNRPGQQLSARLEMPVGGYARAYAIFAHCFTCNKDLKAVRNISRALSNRGFGVLRLDFTGLGESEGDFAETDFTSNVSDIAAAADYLTAHHEAPTVVIGHSLGGAAALFAAHEIDSIQAVVTIGSPADPGHVTHLFSNGLEAIERDGRAEVNIGGRPFTIGKQFVDDISKKDLTEVLAEMRKALLICHSPQDTIVGIDNAARLYTAARHPKSFVSLDGADHLLSRGQDSVYVGEVIAAWVSRYLDGTDSRPVESVHQVDARIEDTGYTTFIRAGKHELIADEPKSLGGGDLGPAPYELVSAGLASCTAITIRMYVERKGWPMESLEVSVDHKQVPNEADPTKKSDVFERSIAIGGPLDEAQRARILSIADKCPVHRSLEASAEILTSLR